LVIYYGVVVVLPVIIGRTMFACRVFWGKSTAPHTEAWEMLEPGLLLPILMRVPL
jgi:hypothetical protein